MEENFYSVQNPAKCCNESSSSSSMEKLNDSNKQDKKIKKKKGKVLKLSTDPQSVAARVRRHRISERFKILRSMVPGGAKMDTVSMLDEAIHYVKFLKAKISLHQSTVINFMDPSSLPLVVQTTCPSAAYYPHAHPLCSQTTYSILMELPLLQQPHLEPEPEPVVFP